MHNPVTTYRLQFHKGFTFTDFEKIIPYLYQLGIKTVYASPIFEAAPGSTHGYDVVNPYLINPEIGTLEQLKTISKKLHELKINWLQDIVPNHMAFHQNNKWLMDVLEKGKRSVYASFFDIQWDSPIYNGRLMVPFLGEPINEAINGKKLKIDYQQQALVFTYGGQNYPLNVASYLTLLKGSTGKVDLKEIIGKIENLDKLTGNKAYSEQSDALKAQLEPVFTGIFTKAFLENANNDSALLLQIASEQAYQLCYWQETDQQINFRRFFTVNGLICLNIQDAAVFEHYHRFIKTLLDLDIFQGLRVDHIDGLYNPEEYLQRLRSLAGEDTYIIVEKILEAGEAFPLNWPVQGNTGYDFLSTVNNLFTLPESKKAFSKLYKTLTHENTGIQESILQKKALIINDHMAGEMENLYRLFLSLQLADEVELREISAEQMKAAISAMLIHCPVYRFYGNAMPLNVQETGAVSQILKQVLQSQPDLGKTINILENALLKKTQTGDTDYNTRSLQFYQRCMQFTGPAMAKGVEDTLMYTYNRFIGHNEVGDSPASFGITVTDFDKTMIDRQQQWPHSMNATATHDTKRGEDVRARLNVLTDIAEEWTGIIHEWREINAGLKVNNAPDNNDEYFIYQTITGAYPTPGQDDDDFSSRLQEYLVKALREGKQNSNWANPNEQYEAGVKKFIVALLDQKSEFWKSFSAFYKRIADYGIINSLAQVLLKYASPGMPDLYQGCELWDFSLVDPDNRRPVDYSKRDNFLNRIKSDEQKSEKHWQNLWKGRYDAQIKINLTHLLLIERSNNVDIFNEGEYVPLKVKGEHKDHILAFARHFKRSWYIFVLPLHLAVISKKDGDPLAFNWDDTRVILPPDAPLAWQNLLTDTSGHADKGIFIKELFTGVPLAVLKLSHPRNDRSAGILMHITSLPSKFGIGDIGPDAMKFADVLFNSRQKYWQMLPVNPVDKQAGYSPYSSASSMAGNTLLISPELLEKDGLLKKDDLKKYELSVKGPVNFDEVKRIKTALFEMAYQNFLSYGNEAKKLQFHDFKSNEAEWLNDFALYEALKSKHENKPWYQWPQAYKSRNLTTLKKIEKEDAEYIDKVKWLQFIFSKQWAALKNYCNAKSITLLGDMPFYISYDSVDVWANPQLFNLDDKGNMAGMAGVPPDYFSAEGQLWGMPVYCWDVLKETNYAWWIKRIKKNLEYFDLIRLDHFRAFADYWEVPAGEQTAINGKWKQGPGTDFFECVKKELGSLPFVAEDLGNINKAVYGLRDAFGLPGMKVLQFGFDNTMPFSDHIPHNYTENSFAYTGTHDNNTIMGWYKEDISKGDQKRVKAYIGKKINPHKAYSAFIKLIYASVARVAIIPVQDVLGLDASSRMNIPAHAEGNWSWRLAPEDLDQKTIRLLRDLVIFYNR
jgi:malto-oligosyltrehalose synthase/4-alpha-glucanotransferase